MAHTFSLRARLNCRLEKATFILVPFHKLTIDNRITVCCKDGNNRSASKPTTVAVL